MTHKVTLPLELPKILSMRHDNANVLLHECINSEDVNEACYNTSIVDDSSSLNECDTAILKPERTKSKDNYTSFNEDEINQKQKEIPETIGNITAKGHTSLESSRHSNEEESNFDMQSSMKLIRVDLEEEAHSKSEDKFSGGDKFNQEKKKLVIANNIENRKSLNSNLYLDNKEHTVLDSIELNVSPVKSLSYKCNISSKKSENSLEQDYKIKFENIDLCENYQRDNSRMILDDSFLSVTKLNRMTKPRSERLKLLHHRFACQEPPNVRKTVSSCEIEKNVETINPKDTTCDAAKKNDSEKDKKICTVVSTIPKCERLDAIGEDGALNNIAKCVITKNADVLCEKHQNYKNEESSDSGNAQRMRMVRSQSKSDDFETDILKKQRRYLTLPPEDIAHALNLNVSARNLTPLDVTEKNWKQIVTGYCTNHAENLDMDKGQSYGELITGACCTNFYFHPIVPPTFNSFSFLSYYSISK